MSDTNSTIDEILKKIAGSPSALPNLAEGEAEEQFAAKMEEIDLKGKEQRSLERAGELGAPYINLKGFPISSETLTSIPKEQAQKLQVICFLNTGPEIRIGAIDPKDARIKELLFQLEEKFHTHGEVYLISQDSFDSAFKLYASLPTFKKEVEGVEITEGQINKYKEELQNFKDLESKIAGATITDIIAMIIAFSIRLKSSDIHIEAEEKDIKIRYRIDGILNNIAALPKEQWHKIISRIKLISGLKINVEGVPQDGRFTIFIKEGKIDVRVSTLPTSFGESVVMRLLMPGVVKFEFSDLGIRGTAFKTLEREIGRPNGMIIATGPTGSGKSTTLYAILNKLNKPAVKILTLEDPVEYELQGINQSQIDYSKDYTFVKGLRSILRQDPDIVMVGEIRDLETAEIAIQAALTGHLMVSTIHTNDAAGAIPRFLSMGVKPFLLAPALNAIIGQRLVRQICQSCQEEIVLAPEMLVRVKEVLMQLPKVEEYKIDLENLKFYHGKGCSVCNNLGYQGRVGIFEIMIMNKEIEAIILSEKASEYQMREVAAKQGMVTMAQDGLLKALEGLTTVEEVFRVSE